MTDDPISSTEHQPSGERYTHGYHEVIVGSYMRRTAEACAGFLLPRLRPDMVLLDLGCGPGTITSGLARRVGRVVGLDASAEMTDAARNHAADRGIGNATFEVGSAYDLPWSDDSFDVVYAHQVLQHLSEPVRALREARRVLKPGGIVAVRDSDYETMVHAPVTEAIVRWRQLYHQVARANGGEPDAGRNLLSWVTAAGFADPEVTTSSVSHADAQGRAFWGEMWAVRVIDSDFARHAVDHGLSTRAELQEISDAFRRWSTQADGFWAYLCGEVVATCPST
ncbi:MAG: methyltransferase domain-containing protein [Acidimicrobiaceae bacterium]|nr:methyltransferase domain-containing protein [Acidimicrobiaceae bacterium]